jgi:hypothetical protein
MVLKIGDQGKIINYNLKMDIKLSGSPEKNEHVNDTEANPNFLNKL